jgi:uncharacterized repeat protein (TIGR01451 family)
MIRLGPDNRRDSLGTIFFVLVGFLAFLPADRANAQTVPPGCPSELGAPNAVISHSSSASFCELCATGHVRIQIANPFDRETDVNFTDIVIRENLISSGLTYVPNTTSFSGNNIAVPANFEPSVSGSNGSILTWDFSALSPALDINNASRRFDTGGQLFLDFDVQREASFTEESLLAADRRIDAFVDLEASCSPVETFSTSTGNFTLPLNEPNPVIVKQGRNLDAAQVGYSDPVFGHEGDDIVWRVRIRNQGNANLQDLVFDDAITGTNFEINYICDSEVDAQNVATNGTVGGCALIGPAASIANIDVASLFGPGTAESPYIASFVNGSRFYYFTGRITQSCSDETNTVNGVEWGCQSQPPAGGLSATSTGATAQASALLRTNSVEANVDINVALTGVVLSQDTGATGTVTITLTNNSGGTITGEAAGLRIRNQLPPQYVVDPTFTPTIVMAPAFGTYDGMINTVEWTNPHPNTVPILIMGDPADPLSNTELNLLLTSDTIQVNDGLPNQEHMIRHGDVVTITIRTVLIDQTVNHYDYVADLDVRTEAPDSTPPGTDPIAGFTISNETEVSWLEFCTATLHNRIITEVDTARPEDIDPDINGSELIFILTDTGDPLPLTVELTNNGGHRAEDYVAYVTFGEAMTVQTVDTNCTPFLAAPPRPVWQDPVDLPPTASVFLCNAGTIAPGATEILAFEVVKNTAASFDDDLTFRADVIGEIHLSDGTPLWFPTPNPRADLVSNAVNDYSVDSVWARIIGYNLFKRQLGLCSENNGLTPPILPDSEIQIGEECSFEVESGGWFGFETPGFTYIAVQNVQVVDELPDGLGYLDSSDPLESSTSIIAGVTLNPPPAALDQDFFNWTFNTNVPSERITEKDHWFRVDILSRLMNNPVDSSAPPNVHAAPTSNIMTSTFDAVFFNDSTMAEELFSLGPNTVGYPREVHRRVDLTVTEPNLIVTKEVCNETLNGLGATCSTFLPLVNNGDAFDTYVFRIRVENEAASGGIDRAPAYDVTLTSVTDPTDQLAVLPLTGDAVDNDADGLVDSGDASEGTITDNVVQNGNPAQVIASYTNSDALLRIDPGEVVFIYYRVDPDDDVAPLQALTGSASATYDSLEGEFGAQTTPESANGDIGGARQFTSASSQATIQIIPVEVSPKQVTRVANSGISVPANPQAVSIGEEVEFQLEALIPVAQLRDFIIRDELPIALSCTEAPTINLNAPPYDAAGFVPGGTIVPTCTDTLVEWNFGDQTVTMSNRMDRRFEFNVQFVTRVDNLLGTQDGDMIRNGGASTVTEVRYVNETLTPVVLAIGEAALLVREPRLDLATTFSVLEADAGDIPRVTVTATNSGTATAYNPRFLDDLTGVEFTYRGDIQGANPPTDDVVTRGPNQPIFSWPLGMAILPGDSISFSFALEVDGTVEPERLLPNTIQADWTSLPGQATSLNPSGMLGPDGSPTGMRIGALPNAADPLNNYESTVSESLPVSAVQVEKTDLAPTQAPEIGSHRDFEIQLLLPEGITRNIVVNDALDSGSASYFLAHNANYDITYVFEGLVDINGATPDEAAFLAVPADNTSGTATWSIGTVTTLSEDDLATDAIRPAIRIRYSARINNDLATNIGSTLQNTASLASTHGETGLSTTVTAATATITVTESAVTATKVLRNVTPGKLPADPPAFNDTLQYVLTFVNGGNATAYDVNVVDTLPAELELTLAFTPTATIDTGAVVGFVAAPTGAPKGPLIWGRANGDNTLDLPAGSFMELTYQVVVNSPPIDGTVISNTVYTDWTSLDVDSGSLFERTGAGCPTTTAPNDYCFGPAVSNGTVDPAPPASPLVKTNTQPTAAVGEVFRYRITIPQTPYPFPSFDIRVYDDLTASAANMRFLSATKISGSAEWTPVNTGTPTDLVLEDTTNGIDIPAGEQVVLEIAVVLEDTPTNTTGLTFTNTANYIYNWLEGNLTTQRTGAAGTSANMTIVGPDTLTMTKTGPASMTLGAPATFTLDLQNADTGSAWNLRLFDRLPNGATASACDVAPVILTAQVFQSDGTTPVSAPLDAGSDFTVAFRGAPDCDFTVDFVTPATTLGATERLILTYQSVLDDDSQNGETLTNIAGVTQWFSADGSLPDTAADRRSFTQALSNGTVGTLDHEDAFTTLVALPVYVFEKTVVNQTTGENPATTAFPGDVLRYTLRLQNLRNAPLENIAITDELDQLNASSPFEVGSLQLVTVPVGADTSNTNAAGGATGTGLVDIRGLSLLNQNDALDIVFDATLGPVLPNASIVANQAQATTAGVLFATSDDPILNGPADPIVLGDEDPTTVLITSAPAFEVDKTSNYVTGDPTVLLAGETLRYTIIVQNVGNDNASDASLRDAIPVNTAYTPGSTTLNGIPVPDAAGGLFPFAAGMPISALEDPTAGAMRADLSPLANNSATLIFDVLVDPGAIDGTVISNQAFVSAVLGGVSDQASDDPDTPVLDDPTQDVVGNAPLLFAPKSAVLLIDGGTIGVVDPGDTLRYTITVFNNGAGPAMGASLSDGVPTNTTYIAESLTLNTLPIGIPDGGVSPLIAGIDISSGDLNPPTPGTGQINIGESAVVTFDLLVDATTPGGTILSNQALVRSLELPNLLTDGDGNPATGPEPTLVVVGNGQQLAITKNVVVLGGGPALPGSELEYTVAVTNISTAPATNVVITDDLDQPVAGQLTIVPGTATLDGTPTDVTVLGSLITADYSIGNGPLVPSASTVLRFRATLEGTLPVGTNVTNTGTVQWNAATQVANATVSVAIGGTPGVGAVNGTIWHDSDFDRVQAQTERVFADWVVTLFRNGQSVQSVTTDTSGDYRLDGVTPNDLTGDAYALRFRAPDASANSASLGRAESSYTNGLQSISDIIIPAGSNLQGLFLPIDPAGVVYEALQRVPASGVSITLVDPVSANPVSASCFDDPNQQGQVTRVNGFYKFDLNFSDASCPDGGEYLIVLTPSGTDFSSGPSQIIPPTTDQTTAAFPVPACPGNSPDAVIATTLHCEVQSLTTAPPVSIPARAPGTDYYLHLSLDSSQSPGSSQLFNNHLAIDPPPGGAIGLIKTTPSLNVSRGDLIPYEIVFTNQLSVDLTDLTVRDRFPAGFRYIEGSARVDGTPMEPTMAGRVLEWPNLTSRIGESRTIVLLLAVGAGVTEGEFVNRAESFSSATGLAYSGEASATVRVVPDPTFDCTDVLGKVFDDHNRNGIQDEGEDGLPDVRLMTVRGLAVYTDTYGRFHITCAIVPNETRGSNFVLKLDDRTLPSGYRMSTRQTQVGRATRGKSLRFRFGASIHRIVSLDLADAVFEPGTTTMRAQWEPRLSMLLDELEKEETTLRLSYLADVEDSGLVKNRVAAIEKRVRTEWKKRGKTDLTIETEIYWRRGAPAASTSPQKTSRLETGLPHVGAGPPGWSPASGNAGEQHFPVDSNATTWTVDPESLTTLLTDRIERRQVAGSQTETVKLANLLPAIYFESGVAKISTEYVAKLREVLDGMAHLQNVRLHLVGHTDDQPLSAKLSRLFGDNQGLSRERAGEVAEFLQSALTLAPESISFAWMGDKTPVAPNNNDAGRARNRRVEVEVWYDESFETVSTQELVVAEEIKRYKVCRTETVCKLRYREGHERRARIKNLLPPLNYDDEIGSLPAPFVQQIQEALFNLRNKQNVTVKFIAHTDDLPLSDRAARIYGNARSISKARSRRVALEVRDALNLRSLAVDSEGRGATQPVASNATPQGRRLNRRIEVEFWHDDPLLELSDEFQACPDPTDAESVTRVYNPVDGAFRPLTIRDGEILIPAGLGAQITRSMAELSDKESVRVRFVGYTRNERLSRRMAEAYGDDIGLSTARARRGMERVQLDLDLTNEQVEHEGRGFVHSEDVVNGGFLQGETSHVIVQVVYDELAVMDDYEGIAITPITRELRPKDPLALNLMRITINGEPLDDPGRSSADIQRCTDVALDQTNIAFRFDDLEDGRRLSVSSTPAAAGAGSGDLIRFRMYNNYPHFIDRAEIRIFDERSSVRDEPVAILDVDGRGFAQWTPPNANTSDPIQPLKFVLRAYGAQGRFDETAAQSLWMTPLRVSFLPADDLIPDADSGLVPTPDNSPAEGAPSKFTASGVKEDEAESDSVPSHDSIVADTINALEHEALLAGYGESGPVTQNIPLGSAGAVRVSGQGIPSEHSVWLAGTELPVADSGDFVGEVILPSGMHTVEVAVLDDEGNGELFLRDLQLERNDWFFMALADLTLAQDLSGGRPNELSGNNSTDLDSFANGRLAFFVNGKFGDDWKLIASADTREGSVEELFTNFLDKSPASLFRRLDPDYHYSTFGDDSVIDELAPTLGKFYVKLNKGDDHLLWGNFLVRYNQNELALVERGLYGANARYQSEEATYFGERRFSFDAFAADPGTIPSREEFRGTGGSVYFLKRQDLLIGSERIRIEIRDKDSGLVTEVVTLQPQLDYDIDYLQGRVLLSQPLSAIADDRLLVRNDGLSGNQTVLVVQYEFTPGFDSVDTLNVGGQGHAWLTDFLKLGATANHNEEDGVENSLYAADLTLRKSAGSWFKIQAARSEGLVSTSQRSDDGGFSFIDPIANAQESDDAYGYRADISIELDDLWSGLQGKMSFYGQRLDAGYSAAGLNVLTDTDQYGGIARLPILDSVAIVAKADHLTQDRGLETTTAEVDVAYQVTDNWSLEIGVRHDERQDDSATPVATQDEGDRTDVVAEVEFDSEGRWTTFAFGQATAQATGSRKKNHRGGVGGSYRMSEKLAVDGEVSHGDLGPAAQIGTDYQYNKRTQLYLNYALDNERGYDGLHERRGSVTTGTRSRLSDSTSVYAENQYQHDAVTGITRSMGVTYIPSEMWNVDLNWEDGKTTDRQTQAETTRRAGGVRVGFRFEDLQLSTGVEYIFNETEQSDGSQSDRTTWLFRNNMKYQWNEDGRLLLKFNHAMSDSSQGDFFDGGFTEAVIGYAYRPIAHDRLNALAKYTYFYNVPSTDQVGQNGTASQFIQKSHVASLDVTYDVTDDWTLGAKYGYRRGEISVDRDNTNFFSNDAHLYILRADYRLMRVWEFSLEGRMLHLPDLNERRAGALTTAYRYFGDHFKVGIGYNFTDFSEDLTDLSFDHHGVFLNVIGTF